MKKGAEILLLCCSTVVGTCAYGQSVTSAINKQDLQNFVYTLSSDSMEGRATGTKGEERAARFIHDRFRKLGLETRYEPFKLKQVYWGEVYLKAGSRTLKNFDGMVLQGGNPQNEESDKEVVFGGTGTEAELDQIDVTNRMVLVFVGNLRSSYQINRSLVVRKAYGLIIANPDNEKQFESVARTYKDFALQRRLSLPRSDSTKRLIAPDTLRLLNTLVIPNSEVKPIVGLTINALNGLIKEKNIRQVPVTRVKVKFERIESELDVANILGSIPGKTEKKIVISAHYDHLGKLDGELLPGADDNASGTAAMLEIAEAFSKRKNLEYGLTFIATTAEEAGLLGSLYHVYHPSFDAVNILCNLNLDMVGIKDRKHSNADYLYVIGSDQHPALHKALQKADSLYVKCDFDFTLNNSKGIGGLFSRSDNFNFYKRGVPALHFFSGFSDHYHKPTDTADKIDFAILENRARQITFVIEVLQRDGLNPLKKASK